MTCLIDLNLFYIIIEIFNIKSLVTSIIPELFGFVKNFTFDNSTYNVRLFSFLFFACIPIAIITIKAQ